MSESPVEDVVEQRAEVVPEAEHVPAGGDHGIEVDPADAAEQDREVPLDEEEWR